MNLVLMLQVLAVDTSDDDLDSGVTACGCDGCDGCENQPFE